LLRVYELERVPRVTHAGAVFVVAAVFATVASVHDADQAAGSHGLFV
jgi:hypothetical protein